LRTSIVSTPAFAAFAIGVSGQASFRSTSSAGSFAVPREAWSLCIGRPACPTYGRSPTAGDAGSSVKAGSIRLITDLGPVGATALGLFANPVATPARPVALRLAPMFACGGGGLEMRAAWW
jgi:hypothetical protein